MSTLTYNCTFIKDTDVAIIDCNLGANAEYKKVQWNRVNELNASKTFTSSGDATQINRYSTVTINTPQVTALGWFEDYSSAFQIYCVLYTDIGTSYTSEVQWLEWDENNSNRTITFILNNVVGEWTHFEVWARMRARSKDNGNKLYWFNNNNGVISVVYEVQEGGLTTIFYNTTDKKWTVVNTYIHNGSNFIESQPNIVIGGAFYKADI